MRCWACSDAIGLHDHVCELPLAGTLVHARCFERETGLRDGHRETLATYLARRGPYQWAA
ncbi:MAG: hypothetical protein FJ027_04220 [Candidatus Rokubacteria bacterium]|nr:hypothetical protein [Candidatus Rokubacteria bacterium]